MSKTPASHHQHGNHDHGHFHAGHSHVTIGPGSYGEKRFVFGLVLNGGFVVVEAVAAFLTGSVALLADAAHNLTDVLGLVVGLIAARAALKRPSGRFTFGPKRAPVLGALFNSVAVLGVGVFLAFEAIERFLSPHEVASIPVMIVASIGVVINLSTVLLFFRGKDHDLNQRGAFLHMAADALVSVAVVIGALLIQTSGALWIDPVLALMVVGVIVSGSWSLFREALASSLDEVPKGLDTVRVRDALLSHDGVLDVHGLHLWRVGQDTHLTCHIVIRDSLVRSFSLASMHESLKRGFCISHSTIQIEYPADGAGCIVRCNQLL